MNALAGFVFSVFAASMICGVLQVIGKETGFLHLIKLLCGIFLMLTVLVPVSQISLEGISPFAIPYSSLGEQAAKTGEDYARNSLSWIIKEETQSYILDKANQMGASIIADVTVSSDPIPIPVSVSITGDISGQQRLQLEELLTKDLNIAKENQTWTG